MDCSGLWPAPGVDPRNWWGHLLGHLLRGSGQTGIARPFLIGIRGVAPGGKESRELVHRPDYDDTLVLLQPNAEPHICKGATHAYQRDSKLSDDVNHDGRGDVASIVPGRYLLHARGGAYPVFILTKPDGDGRIPCLRDTDHDLRPETPSVATAILLHTGPDAPPDAEHRSSIGCQTAPVYFLRMLDRACRPGDLCDYVLISAERAVELMEDFGRTEPENMA